jgi:hypothetical protein
MHIESQNTHRSKVMTTYKKLKMKETEYRTTYSTFNSVRFPNSLGITPAIFWPFRNLP